MTTQLLELPRDLRRVRNSDGKETSAHALKISIVIPARNEGKNLRRVVGEIMQSMFDLKNPFEILVVDDGSLDDTLDISSKLAVNDSRIIVVRNHSSYGKGFSLRKGFGMARGDLIITMDGDGQHLPEDIPKLIQAILDEKADLALGSRFLNGDVEVPIRHWLGNKVASLCFNLFYQSNFKDVLMGFRAFRRDFLEGMNLDFDGYLVEVEMLVKALKKNAKIVQVQTRCRYTRKSSLLRGIGMVARIVAGLILMKITNWQTEHQVLHLQTRAHTTC